MAIGRRQFISVLGGAGIAWPLAARAQQSALPVIGFLNTQSSVGSTQDVAGFRKGLNQTDFSEGQNVAVEYRWADGQYDRLPEMAADLLSRKVAVIVAAFVPAVLAAKAATSTIPVVFISGLDPVASSLVTSMNRPEGNLTGISNYNVALVAKRLEMMHQVVPQAGAIALLVNPNTATSQSMEAEGNRAAQVLGLRLILKGQQLPLAPQQKQPAFAPLEHPKVGHRPADWGVISLPILQRAWSHWGRVKWPSASEEGNSYPRLAVRLRRGRSPHVRSSRRCR